MNNQFFGDERDFYKYALLRILSKKGKCSIAVCWLLTTGIRKGGSELAYLCNSDYRQKDEELFDFLHEHICDKEIRDVSVMNNKIICRAKFFADEFPLSGYKRDEYWKKFIKEHGTNELLFFDADTGIMPPSREKRKNSKNEENEYIRKEEIEDIWVNCKQSSLMIFQYFSPMNPSKKQQERHEDIMTKLRNIDEQANIFCLHRCTVAYYFMIRKNHNKIYDGINFAKKELGFIKHD